LLGSDQRIQRRCPDRADDDGATHHQRRGARKRKASDKGRAGAEFVRRRVARHIREQTIDVLSEAELTLGFINGQGLGSFLLAFVLVAFIFGPTRDGSTVRRVVRKVLESFERKSTERN